MATLPETSIDISAGVELVTQPSRTWGIDTTTGRLIGDVDGLRAVQQAVETILDVQRFQWQIFQPYSGMEWRDLIGRPTNYVSLELRRRMLEALLVDDRVTGITKFDATPNGENLVVDAVVSTVFGNVEVSLEVNA